MKRITFAVAVSMILLASCTNESPEGEKHLSLEKDSESVDFQPQFFKIAVTSDTSWSTESNAEWCIVTPKEGSGDGALLVTFEENESTTVRTATVTVTGNGTEPATLTVTQGAQPDLGVDIERIDALAAGGEYTFNIRANTDWKITVPETSDWLEVSPLSGNTNAEVTVRIAEYDDWENPRSTTLTVYSDWAGWQRIIVKQERFPFDQPASGTLAYSNVLLADGKLVFATMPAELEKYPVNSQGLYFKWGSLLGISPAGEAFDASKVVFKPAEFTDEYTDEWTSVAFEDAVSTSTDLIYDFFADTYKGSGYDAVAGKGDVCRYISAQGWVKGRWRLPIAQEYVALKDAGWAKTGDFSLMSGSDKDDGTYLINAGITFGSEGSDEARFVPCSTRRNRFDGVIESDYLGILGNCWTATPNGRNDAGNLGIGGGGVFPKYTYGREFGFSVRCVAE
jgi:hypothetical protein